MEEAPNELTIVYEKAEGKRTITATGAHGGPTPDGASVVVNLYVEKASTPHHVTHEISESGQVDLSKQSGEVKRGEITREIQASLVMDPEHALQVGRFLQQNAEQAMKQRDQSFG